MSAIGKFPIGAEFVEGVDSEAIGVLEKMLSITSLEARGATNIEFLPKYQMLYALRA